MLNDNTNKLNELFGVEYPIIQGGMVWCSGWRLASAVSNSGGLGLLGAGSMHANLLEEHILKCKSVTDKPFGVNIPLLYAHADEHIKMVIKHRVPIVFTSAGSPKKWTGVLKEEGIKVVHVVSSVKFALKSQEAGVDAVVAEGFEAGGHNGREETTTLCLIPAVARELDIPLIAAGGIATGEQMLAAMVLGASGVQIGSRFAASKESSAHDSFKQKVVEAGEGDTVLTLKEIAPVRLLKSPFFDEVQKGYETGMKADELKMVLGKGRAKKGIFEGNWTEGEWEIGQVSSLINTVESVDDIFKDVLNRYRLAKSRFTDSLF